MLKWISLLRPAHPPWVDPEEITFTTVTPLGNLDVPWELLVPGGMAVKGPRKMGVASKLDSRGKEGSE